MTVSTEGRIIKLNGIYGIKCPDDWNGYVVTIHIYPKGLWKGIKYITYKHKGKQHKCMLFKDMEIYWKRVIHTEGTVLSMFSMRDGKFIEFVEVDEQYRGLKCTVLIKNAELDKKLDSKKK